MPNPSAAQPRVMVSGSFDLLQSGHVALLEQSATHGQLHVALVSDRTFVERHGRSPAASEQQRLLVLRTVSCVHEAFIASGSSTLDFLPDLERLKPDKFIVSPESDSLAKRFAVEELGVRYVVLRRPAAQGTPGSGTTVPYRLDLAGGWLDQPFVSRHHPGLVINCSLEPRQEYELRSGMASSTRQTAIRLWGPNLPADDREKLARTIFACENPPGTTDVAGSQDAIGLVYPGVNRLQYNGEYWPQRITTILEPGVLDFVEAHVQLLFAGARPPEMEVLTERNIDAPRVKELADAADECWESIVRPDAVAFGRSMKRSFEAQVAMFPRMLGPQVARIIEEHRARTFGHKITGAGGGGYVVFVTDRPIEGAVPIKIRREV